MENNFQTYGSTKNEALEELYILIKKSFKRNKAYVTDIQLYYKAKTEYIIISFKYCGENYKQIRKLTFYGQRKFKFIPCIKNYILFTNYVDKNVL